MPTTAATWLRSSAPTPTPMMPQIASAMMPPTMIRTRVVRAEVDGEAAGGQPRRRDRERRTPTHERADEQPGDE